MSLDYEEKCGLSLEPSTVGALSNLTIASYVHSTEDTHNYIHYPTDCIVLNFAELEDYGDYVPVPENVTCNFTIGGISCHRINGTQIKLQITEMFDLLEGTIGPI